MSTLTCFPPRASAALRFNPTEFASLVTTPSGAPIPYEAPNQNAASINISHHQVLNPLPRRLVGVSSKAYFTHARTLSYARSLLQLPPTNPEALQIFFIPSFPGVSTCSLMIQQALTASSPSPPCNLLLGAQDCHFALSGPHTGSVTASELSELGCTFVELGHAERRRPPLSESDEVTATKARMAVSCGLVPLVCVGEIHRPAEGRAADALKEVGPQVEAVLGAIGEKDHVVFAYEPVWAIGQKEPAPSGHVCKVVREIKKLVQNRTGQVRVIYGGSAGPGIWEALKGDVDGLFLGRFGHDVEALRKVVEEMGKD